MRLNLIPAALLCSTLLAPVALAQTLQVPAGDVPPPAGVANDAGFAGPDAIAAQAPFITRREPGVLRISDLLGKRVHSLHDDDLGEVEDVLVNQNGRIVALVIEVGGFLGMGEREVAVPPSAIRINPYDMTATTGTMEGAGLAPSTAAGVEARDANRISRAIVPERVVLTVPVEALRAAPPYLDTD
ncbi:PRC-barrel domain-containing protein [Microvirga splendida]|uniref:PRC-barrel domain-containing protein n=1 Tax=Microvirga splendida TaxID=2795727 RepID=A0ABS0Y805_9HYPH|nr:PRC-barrel domain-containing protein [Microvirga splendida]MBJ6128436.1 PRC-barrel domain-containing protein [Microvirga splendida]